MAVLSYFVFISYALAASIQQRQITQNKISHPFFKKLVLSSQYAAAAYCPLKSISTNTQIKCFSGNCPAVEKSAATFLAPIKASGTKSNEVTGFIAKDPINNAIIISFRGTHSKDDIATDVNYHLVPARSICLRCEASHGFWRAWSDVKDGVLGTLGGDKKRKIVVTGHSLGGALASIAAADLRGIGYVVDMYTFGAPRFGNAELINHLNTTSPSHGINVRVTHANDPVPQVPFKVLGHTDLWPEYYISKPTNQSVTIGDISILAGSEFLKGSTGQMPKDITSHGWYFNQISACANGTFLEGEYPSSTDVQAVVSWMESTGWWMVDNIFNLGNSALSTALELIGIRGAPKIPSPTTIFPKDSLSSLLAGKRPRLLGEIEEST